VDRCVFSTCAYLTISNNRIETLRQESTGAAKIFATNAQQLTLFNNTLKDVKDFASPLIRVILMGYSTRVDIIGNLFSDVVVDTFITSETPTTTTVRVLHLYMRNNTFREGGNKALFKMKHFSYDIQYNIFDSLVSFLGQVGSSIFTLPETTLLGPAIIKRNIFLNPIVSYIVKTIKLDGYLPTGDPIDLTENYWSGYSDRKQYLNPRDWIYRESCMPISTLPFLVNASLTSDVTWSNYSDQVQMNRVITGNQSFPFGITAYDTSLTIAPGAVVELGECGIELNHCSFYSVGNATHRIRITSSFQRSIRPLLVFSAPDKVAQYTIDYVDFDLKNQERPGILEFNLQYNSTETSYIRISNSNFMSPIYTPSDHLNLTSKNMVSLEIRNSTFFGNSAIRVNCDGPFLFDRNNLTVQHNDTRVSLGIYYRGSDVKITNSNFTTNAFAVDTLTRNNGPVVLEGNLFTRVTNPRGTTVTTITAIVIGSDVIVRNNTFTGLNVDEILSISNAVTRGIVQGNTFIKNTPRRFLVSFRTMSGTKIVATNNTLVDNTYGIYAVNIITMVGSTNVNVVWNYNSMANSLSFSNLQKPLELLCLTNCDLRYNYWGTDDTAQVITKMTVGATKWNINPYLNNDPQYGINTTDCVAKYGRQVNENCKFGTCSGYSGLLNQTCSGRGICNLNNTCTCDTGYYGLKCEKFNCFNKTFDDPSVCNFGTCVNPDTCICKVQQSGENCEFYSCDGISALNTSACSGNGYCTSSNTCNCKPGYNGFNCDMWFCKTQPRIKTEACPAECNFPGDNGCNKKGICIAPETCKCYDKYGGSWCEEFYCYDIINRDPHVCSGHGSCAEPDFCKCNDGYKGDQCEIPICCKRCYWLLTISRKNKH
jgi:hypothetical protein